MSEDSARTNRFAKPSKPVYCHLHHIGGFEEEKTRADPILSAHANGRICICILPVLEDGMHYYLQCNFKRAIRDEYDFKILDTFEKLCNDRVLPRLDRENYVEAHLFLTSETLEEFAAQPVHQGIRQKFEIVTE
jgi:hypothetical protein